MRRATDRTTLARPSRRPLAWAPGSDIHGSAEERLTYRVAEVERMLGVSQRTLWKWIRDGRLGSRKVGGARLVPAQALAALLHGHQVTAVPGARTADPEADRIAREMLG